METALAKLCPVMFALPGGFLVVMQRATPLTDAHADGLDYHELLTFEDGLMIPAEAKRSSFGMLGERIVVIAYGDYCA
jgi:hypothetical protein